MSFARAIATVSGITMLSRVAGFIRDTLAATMLGAGPVSDAFFVALRLPNLFRSLFAEGAFSAAFVPLYAKAFANGGSVAAKQFAAEAMAVLVSVLLPFTLLMMLFMPQVMLVLAPGFGDRPEVFALAVSYARITFPYLMLISGTALLTGILNSNKQFAPGAAAPILFNLMMILALLLSPLVHGEPGMMMAWAVTLSGILQWAWMHWHCRKMGIAPPLLRPQLSPQVKALFKAVGPGAIGAGATQINLALSTILASFLPAGAVSYLFYADRLNQLPLGVIGIAISSTLLPVLSAKVQANDQHGIRHFTTRAVEFGLILGLPAAIGLGVASHLIIQVLFEHGVFDAVATTNTAAALTAYVFGVVPFILVKILSAIFFAHHDTKTPVKIAMIAVAVNVSAALLLLGPFGHVGIASATSLATWVNLTLLGLALRRAGLLQVDPAIQQRGAKIAGAAIAMALFLFLTRDYLGAMVQPHHTLGNVLILAGYLTASAGLYGAVLLLSRAVSIAELKLMVQKKGKETS